MNIKVFTFFWLLATVINFVVFATPLLYLIKLDVSLSIIILYCLFFICELIFLQMVFEREQRIIIKRRKWK